MYKGYIHKIFDDIINKNQHTITIFINTIYSRKCCIICKLYLMFFSQIILFYVECLKQCNSYSSSLYYYFITLYSVTIDVSTLNTIIDRCFIRPNATHVFISSSVVGSVLVIISTFSLYW